MTLSYHAETPLRCHVGASNPGLNSWQGLLHKERPHFDSSTCCWNLIWSAHFLSALIGLHPSQALLLQEASSKQNSVPSLVKAFICSASFAVPKKPMGRALARLILLAEIDTFPCASMDTQAQLRQALSLQQLRQHQLLPIQETQKIVVNLQPGQRVPGHCKILIASISTYSCCGSWLQNPVHLWSFWGGHAVAQSAAQFHSRQHV